MMTPSPEFVGTVVEYGSLVMLWGCDPSGPKIPCGYQKSVNQDKCNRWKCCWRSDGCFRIGCEIWVKISDAVFGGAILALIIFLINCSDNSIVTIGFNYFRCDISCLEFNGNLWVIYTLLWSFRQRSRSWFFTTMIFYNDFFTIQFFYNAIFYDEIVYNDFIYNEFFYNDFFTMKLFSNNVFFCN